MNLLQMPLQASVGIDVAKRTLDVLLLRAEKKRRASFANTPEGFEQLLAWVQQEHVDEIHFCLEATGIYSQAIAQFLYERSCKVSVINPRLIHAYRKSHNLRRKNDQVDAGLLALYAQERAPESWKPLAEPVRQLLGLLSYRDLLQRMIGQVTNRLESSQESWVREQEEQMRKEFEQREKTTFARMKAIIESNEELKRVWKRLQTIVGISEGSATYVVAHVGEIERFHDASALVNYVGLSVSEHTSGTSVWKAPHIDRQGRGQLRKILYMCALAAKRFDPKMQAWAQQLEDRGKAKKVAVVAVMRKLVHIIYGVWKHGQDYDPARAFPHAA